MNRREMHEKMKYIQNSFWQAYVNLTNSNNMSQYNKDVDELMTRFKKETDKVMITFLNSMMLTWAGFANEIVCGHFDKSQE